LEEQSRPYLINRTVNAGYYDATTLQNVDPQLIDKNIKNSVCIFNDRTLPGLPDTGQTANYNAGDDSVYNHQQHNHHTQIMETGQ